MHFSGQFPAKVKRVLKAEVQPLPAARRMDVRGAAVEGLTRAITPGLGPTGVRTVCMRPQRIADTLGAGTLDKVARSCRSAGSTETKDPVIIRLRVAPPVGVVRQHPQAPVRGCNDVAQPAVLTAQIQGR